MKAGTLPKSLKSAPPVPKSMFVGKLRLPVPPAFDLNLAPGCSYDFVSTFSYESQLKA